MSEGSVWGQKDSAWLAEAAALAVQYGLGAVTP